MANYNIQSIRAKRSYSIIEISDLLGIDRKTCSRWIKNKELKPIEKNVSPLLIMGIDLINFLKERRAKNKITLKKNEFFCAKCHKAVKAKVGSEKALEMRNKIGRANLKQFKKIGICEFCGTKLNRFLKACQKD